MEFSAKEPLLIDSEDAAWDALQKTLSGEYKFNHHRAIRFDGWPKSSAYVADKRLDSALTPYMMEGYVDLQRAVFRSFALLSHKQANARLLSDAEKERLELVVQVDGGSSDSEIDWTEIILRLVDGLIDKMEPTHLIILILGSGLLFASHSLLRRQLDKKKDEKIADTQTESIKEFLKALKYSQENDLERWKVMNDASNEVPELLEIQEDVDEAKLSLTRHYTKGQDAKIDGVEISQEAGQRLTRSSRSGIGRC